MYWKLLIFLFCQRSVSLDFLKTDRGLRLLNDRSNGALQLPLNLAWNKSRSLVPLKVKNTPNEEASRVSY